MMVESIETMPEAIGVDSTKYFLRDFSDYAAAFSNPDFFEESHEDVELAEELQWKFNEELLTKFLEWPEYSYWKGFIKTNGR